MYNQEQKEKFLEQLTINAAPFISMFKISEPYEEERQRDLAEFSKEDFEHLLANGLGLTQSSLRLARQRINHYLKWCRDNNIPTTLVGNLNIIPDKSGIIRDRMVGSPEELSWRMDRVFQDRKLATVGCLYRCYLWMLFMGFNKQEPANVLTEEVDLSSLSIIHNGVEYDIPPTALIDFMHAVNCNEFIHSRAIGKQDAVYHARVDSPYLLRGLRTEQLSFDTLQRHVRSLQTKQHIGSGKLVPKQIIISGFFWRAYQIETQSGVPYLSPIIEKAFCGTEISKDPESKPATDYHRYLTFKYTQDYYAWKNAFNLQ